MRRSFLFHTLEAVPIRMCLGVVSHDFAFVPMGKHFGYYMTRSSTPPTTKFTTTISKLKTEPIRLMLTSITVTLFILVHIGYLHQILLFNIVFRPFIP